MQTLVTYRFFIVQKNLLCFFEPKFTVTKRIFVAHIVNEANNVRINPLLNYKTNFKTLKKNLFVLCFYLQFLCNVQNRLLFPNYRAEIIPIFIIGIYIEKILQVMIFCYLEA